MYTIPCGQNPTGSVPTEARFDAIYKICSEHDVIIMEDDPYRKRAYSSSLSGSSTTPSDTILLFRLITSRLPPVHALHVRPRSPFIPSKRPPPSSHPPERRRRVCQGRRDVCRRKGLQRLRRRAKLPESRCGGQGLSSRLVRTQPLSLYSLVLWHTTVGQLLISAYSDVKQDLQDLRPGYASRMDHFQQRLCRALPQSRSSFPLSSSTFPDNAFLILYLSSRTSTLCILRRENPTRKPRTESVRPSSRPTSPPITDGE
jgi:hypothetical protein